ncbi:hypothetical protein RAN53_09455 [Halomonas sp. SSL-5]|uniref:hypothetical protein n=1 Tax=Halomonas sp. SSL-5 TaxID=3065855 RepID=UPI0027388C74|nr:hypothetical protein [Halomonas sp. SSL-5]MDY7116576.1 hypothetical protein [Halomonas sp. SSL-5]
MRKPKTWVAWSPEQDEQLETLVLEGVTHRQIAAMMGRPLESIRSRCKHRKIRKPRDDVWSDEQMDFLILHYGRHGWTFQRIANELPGEPRRTRLACKDKAVRLGLTEGNSRGHTQKLPPIYVERCLMLAMQDLTTPEIAERLGVSPAWAARTINASPYHRERYRERESLRRGYGQSTRYQQEVA